MLTFNRMGGLMNKEWKPSLEDMRDNYIKYCSNFIDVNKECYVAQWVLQNPDKNIEDYVLCHQTSVNNSRMWMEKK